MKRNLLYFPHFLIFTLIITFTNSCVKTKDVVLLQGNFVDSTKNLSKDFDFIIEKNDILEISLLSTNTEANNLFKTKFEEGKSVVSYTSGVAAKGGFLVDKTGNIEVPYIGKIYVEGKSRQTITIEIEDKLKEYIQEPIIQINLINFRITILGEVKLPGTYSIPNEKVNLIQAIGIAGDITTFGDRKEIKVIREINGKHQERIFDLTSKEVFSSDMFYLKQNDIIYVQPNKAKIQNTNNQIFIPFVSVASLVITTINLIQLISK